MKGDLFGKAEGIEDGGGYDLESIKNAEIALEGNPNPEKGFEEVNPIFIQVTNNPVVRDEEFEARSVIISYDEYGEVVSVELL